MSGKWEVPVVNPDLIARLQELPLRRRMDFYAGQITFDWTLPPDDSLKVYRANLRALHGPRGYEQVKARTEATHAAKFGHEMVRDSRGKCSVCGVRRTTKRYRLEHGIPLDAPLMTRAEAGGRRRAKVIPIRPDEQLAFELWDRRREVQRLNQRDRISA